MKESVLFFKRKLFIYGLRFLMSAFSLCAFCTRGIESPVMDFGDAQNVKFPEWECHQAYSLKFDTTNGSSYLEVTTFPQKEYPGISLPWITGDWRNYGIFEIIARARGAEPLPFVLSIWDGRGKFIFSNRVSVKFIVDTCWTKCAVTLSGGLKAPNGRFLDIKKISRVLFFSKHRTTPVEFDVRKIRIR